MSPASNGAGAAFNAEVASSSGADRRKTEAAVDYYERAVEAAAEGVRNARAKRDRNVAALKEQVAQAEADLKSAKEALDNARKALES